MFDLSISFYFYDYLYDYFLLSLQSNELNLFFGSLSLIKWKSLFLGASILSIMFTWLSSS